MNTHRRPPYLLRSVPIPRWAVIAAGVVTAALVATTAWAAITPNYNAQCVVTPKSNGGQVLDCDPIAAPSTSPSASPSVSPTVQPSVTPSPSRTTVPPIPSPTVSPTVSPSPSTTGPLKDCLHQLAACGLPNADNTGPTGTLQPSAWTDYWTAGQTVRDIQINGCVVVHANNVTFINVKINAVGCWYGVDNQATGLQLVDSEITCGGANGTGITASSFALTRVDIHGCENGANIDAPGNVMIVDSWIHDLVTCCGAHTDATQVGEGASHIVWRHNTMAVPAPGGNAAIILWDEASGAQNNDVTITQNLLSGGTYTIYCSRYGTPTSVNIVGNRFGPFEYGSSDHCYGSHITSWTGNVVDATNAPLAAA